MMHLRDKLIGFSLSISLSLLGVIFVPCLDTLNLFLRFSFLSYPFLFGPTKHNPRRRCHQRFSITWQNFDSETSSRSGYIHSKPTLHQLPKLRTSKFFIYPTKFSRQTLNSFHLSMKIQTWITSNSLRIKTTMDLSASANYDTKLK